MVVGFRRPDHNLGIPEQERDERVRCSDDLCKTRDGRYFIRCVLEVPIPEMGEFFRWGPWAEVREADFARYLEIWDVEDASGEPAFSGRLANELPPYDGCEGLEVEI